MKRRRSMYLTLRASATMAIALALTLLAGISAEAALLCYDCHGTRSSDIRPVDSAYRNLSTGAFQGNHSTHMPAATLNVNVCVKCHGAASASYGSGHRDGNIQLTLTAPATGTYSKVSPFAQDNTNTPTLGTCSTNNCHFETTTPTWGSAPFSSIANCGACHGAPPTTGAGVHATHGAYTSANNSNTTFKFSTLAGCAKCHPDHATGLKFYHATSATKAGTKINVTLTEGSYTGTGLNYLPSQSGSRSLGQCNSVYCHSPGTLSSGYAAPKTAAVWGSSLGCNGCHDNNNATTTLTAKHLKHVGGTGTNYAISCANCHSATVSNSTTISSVVNHIDKLVTVSFKNRSSAISGTYNAANASSPSKSTRAPGAVPATAYCNNIYCHSQGRSATDYASAAFKGMSTANWSLNLPTGVRACSACHGGDSTNNPSIQRQITSVAHRPHVGGYATNNYNYGCADCHSLTATNNTTINDKTKHANFQKNVDISATYGATAAYTGNNALPGTAAGTCGNVYCHSAGRTSGNTFVAAQAWNNTQLSCTACHGNATTNGGAGVALSTPHASHVNNASVLGTGQTIATIGCVDCHAKTVSNDTTLTSRALHVNALVDYSGVRAGKSSTYTTAGGCTASYCHSSGKKGLGVTGLTEPTAPKWDSTLLTCAGCHGSAGTFGAPTYPTAGGNVAGSNSHALTGHVAAATDCIKCHRKTVNSNGTTLRSYSSLHLDKSLSVYFSAGTYNANKTCSTTLCHGTTSPAWGANTTDDTCVKCHGAAGTASGSITNNNRYLVAPPRDTSGNSGTLTGTGQVSNNVKVGAHQGHLQYKNAFSNYSTADFMCRNCHGTVPASGAHATGSSSPQSTWSNMATKRGAMSPTWTAATVSCSNTYCHNPAGTGGTLNSANVGTRPYVSWTSATYLTSASTKTQANCNKCHKVPEDAGFTSTYNHNSLATSSDCSGCHGHNGTTGGVAGQRHIDGIKYGGGSCDSCHGYDVGTWAAKSERIPAVPEGKGAHEKHIAYLKARYSVTLTPTSDSFGTDSVGSNGSWTNMCGVCHNGATHTMSEAFGGTGRSISIQTTYKFGPNNPIYNGIIGNSSGTTAKNCSNVSCHYMTTPVWSTY